MKQENAIDFVVTEFDSGKRIDKYISESKIVSEMNIPTSRSYVQKLIKNGDVRINDKTVKNSYVVCEGDQVTVVIPDAIIPDILPVDIPLDIVYEDDDVIVINKEKGRVVHPAPGHYNDTIVNALMYHCKDNLSGINGVQRPGIVHRIDMNTTGLIVACKNDNAHQFIAEQLKAHSITRKYEAIVYNHFSDEAGTIDAPLGRSKNDRKKMCIRPDGKPAVTHYKVLANLKNNFAHIECKLETGRTHQIRVHMASIKHPLLGDSIYGPATCPYNTNGQTLHAGTLGFIHPTTKEYMEFKSELPDYFKKILNNLSPQ